MVDFLHLSVTCNFNHGIGLRKCCWLSMSFKVFSILPYRFQGMDRNRPRARLPNFYSMMGFESWVKSICQYCSHVSVNDRSHLSY